MISKKQLWEEILEKCHRPVNFFVSRGDIFFIEWCKIIGRKNKYVRKLYREPTYNS
jgi:hypothetical protein